MCTWWSSASTSSSPASGCTSTRRCCARWREQFAAYLREQGIAANATPGYVRAKPRNGKKDPIHQRIKSLREYESLPEEVRAQRAKPKESSFMRTKVEAVARELQQGRLVTEPGKTKLARTRETVSRAWRAVAQALHEQGEVELSREVEAFVAAMPPVRTEKEQIAAGLLAQFEVQRRAAQKGNVPDSVKREA